MAADYYYLLSSLPYLKRGEPPPWSSAEFLDYCRYHLGPGELAHLEAVQLLPRGGSASEAERRWAAWETALRNQLVRLRAARARRDPQLWLRPETDGYSALEGQVGEALSNPTPLAQEEALAQLRWRQLDECGAGHQFDFDALVVYRLRLLLLEQRAQLAAAPGHAALTRLVASRREQVTLAE